MTQAIGGRRASSTRSTRAASRTPSGDGIGDLAGIADHLDHFGEGDDSLAIDAIWLSPIYPSPDFDFGYDVADYVGVDPTVRDARRFRSARRGAHRRGIRIVIDLVLNHSSHQHPWFQASRVEPDGPLSRLVHLARFAQVDRSSAVAGRRTTGGRSSVAPPGPGSDPRQQFYMHTFLPEQPDLNWRNPEVRAALLDVVRTWLDRGVDGFRLDVFNVFFKDELLRSNPWRVGRRGLWSWQRHIHDRNQPEHGRAHEGPPCDRRRTARPHDGG